MDALFNDEELLLRASIRAQVDKEVPSTVLELENFDDMELWSRLAEGFMLGLGIPESLGGLGTMADASIVATALGERVAPAPYLGSAILAGQLLARGGADSAVLEPLLAGRVRLAVGLDPALRRIAVLGRDKRIFAFDAQGASAALVLDTDGALAAIGVGDELERLDLTRRIRVCESDQRVELGGLGGRLNREQLDMWMAASLVGLSADLVGNMLGSLTLAVEHACSRVQFGVPIGSFQGLQHLIADAYVQSDGARGLVNHAAWAVDHTAPAEALRAATTAKAYCSESAKKVIEAVIQVHGGMGMTWDCMAHVYQRRALANRAVLGDENAHYAALAMS